MTPQKARLRPAERERIARLLETLRRIHPTARTELDYGTPFQLLCAVMLSAQTTDKRVNLVTPGLFARYPDAGALAQADPEAVLALVGSVNYAPTKAKHLVEMARLLLERHGGDVPDTMEGLVALPGVGRKTANVVLSIAFDVPAIAVDTHVFRLARRLGLSKGGTPEAVEHDLMARIPREDWSVAHHWLILHGRYVCTAQKPACPDCALAPDCPALAKGGNLGGVPHGRRRPARL